MKLRKIFVTLLAVIMLMSSLQLTAFAETAGAEEANCSVRVSLYNEICQENDIENLVLSIDGVDYVGWITGAAADTDPENEGNTTKETVWNGEISIDEDLLAALTERQNSEGFMAGVDDLFDGICDVILSGYNGEHYDVSIQGGIGDDGILHIDAVLSCDCPEYRDRDFVIQQEYYKNVDGEKTLIGTEKVMIEVLVGATIYADDFLKTDYQGETYTFTGSYDYTTGEALSEWDLSIEGDYEPGFILRYELVEETAAASEEPKETTDPAETPETTEPAAQDEAPTTGDETVMGFYLVIMTAALAAIGMLKRKEN